MLKLEVLVSPSGDQRVNYVYHGMTMNDDSSDDVNDELAEELSEFELLPDPLTDPLPESE